MHSWQQTLWESQYIVIPVSDHLILRKYSDDYEPVTEVRKDDHCARTILVDNLPSNVTINQVLDCLIINRSEIETTQGTKPKLSYYFWLDKEKDQITCQITFKTATSAQNLIKDNVDVELDGRKLLLKKKHPPRKKVFPWSISGDAGVDSSKDDYRDRTILVNNLPADTNISQILKCLGITNDVETGPNHKLRIMLWKNEKNDKKTCQITFKTAQTAQNCIKNKTSVELNGNRLLLTGMKPLKSRKVNFTADNRSVHLTGLPSNVSAEKLFKIFNELVGGIAKGFHGKPLVFVLFRTATQANGKITFETEESARKCIELSGRPLSEEHEGVVNITIFKVREGEPVKPLHQPPPKTVEAPTKEPKQIKFLLPAKSAIKDNFTVDPLSVHIAGLPKDVTTADIFDAFSTHVGGISMGEDGQPNIFILSKRPDQSFGKVTFNSEELARKCVELSGIQFAEEDKNIVQITLFKTRTNVPPKVPRTLLKKNESVSEENLGKEREKITDTVRASTAGTQATDKTPVKQFRVVENVVHVRGLPKHFTDKDLSQLVQECGKIVRVIVYKNEKREAQGVGIVSFEQATEAASCIEKFHRTALPGCDKGLTMSIFRELVRKPVTTQTVKKEEQRNTTKKEFRVVQNVVYVRGLPKHFAEEDVSKLVQDCGKVRRVAVYKNEKEESLGVGIISFAQPSAASDCIAKFHGTSLPGSERALAMNLFRATQIQNSCASEPGKAYECIICFETCDGKDVMGCAPLGYTKADREAHFACLECIAGHARALCTDGNLAKGGCGIPCATPECNRVLLRAPVLRLLEENSIKQLEKRMDNIALMNIKGFESCKNCDFGAIMAAPKRQMQYFTCQNPECEAQFCRYCKVDFKVHLGKPCSEVDPAQKQDRERKKFEEALSDAVIRRCAKCQTAYQKIDGCNKMTCTNCSTTQCYLCRASAIGYDHFGDGVTKKCQLFEDFKPHDEARLNEVRKNAQGTDFPKNHTRIPNATPERRLFGLTLEEERARRLRRREEATDARNQEYLNRIRGEHQRTQRAENRGFGFGADFNRNVYRPAGRGRPGYYSLQDVFGRF